MNFPDILGQYAFLAPRRIVFGWGKCQSLPELIGTEIQQVWLISGSRTLEQSGLLDSMRRLLENPGREVEVFPIANHEPEVAEIDQLAMRLRERRTAREAILIGVGGGSTLDATKAAAGMVPQPADHSVADYLEGVGRGFVLKNRPLPWIAIPTTAGTGAEATKNAVISSYAPPFKKSFRDDRLLARCVLVDPELTVSVPPGVTAHTGMDALTQLIESYVSRKSAPIPRALSVQGIPLVAAGLPVVVRDGRNRLGREQMAHAALLSGLALANSGLGLAHGVAAALGALCRVPHGLACAMLLPAAMRFNRDCRFADFATIGELLTGKSFSSREAAAAAGIDWVERLGDDLRIPRRLRDVGVTRAQISPLVSGSQGNSLNGNPRDVSPADLQKLLESLW